MCKQGILGLAGVILQGFFHENCNTSPSPAYKFHKKNMSQERMINMTKKNMIDEELNMVAGGAGTDERGDMPDAKKPVKHHHHHHTGRKHPHLG